MKENKYFRYCEYKEINKEKDWYKMPFHRIIKVISLLKTAEEHVIPEFEGI